MSATLLRAADYRVMPWRNGRGSTTELAAGPAGAPLDAFDWRLSIAEVTGDATFSPFPGCDRIITVIAGEGMALEVDGRPHRLLPLRPFGFAGEARVAGRLLGGPTRAFNLMLRRRACAGAVELVPEDGAALGAGEMALVHVVRGAAELTQGGTTLRAGAGETIRIDEAHPGARVRSLMPEGVALLACLRQKVARSS